MAKATRKKAARKARSSARSSSRGRSRPRDAVALLKADHRQVEGWFSEFEDTTRASRKAKLAAQICQALRAHMSVEEEIFYPAFLKQAEEEDIHHEAVVEHAGAKSLIDQIESGSPDDDYYDAKVKVLSEVIKHHVKEEEQPGGMFAKARQADMDLVVLGERMASRRAELLKQPQRRGRAAMAA